MPNENDGGPGQEIVTNLIGGFPDPQTHDVRGVVTKSQEFTRRFLAISFPLSYLILTLILLGFVLTGRVALEDATKIVAILVSPLVAFVGTIIGFYFASKNP